MDLYCVGDKVNTPKGIGTIRYIVMLNNKPDCKEARAYNVRLNSDENAAAWRGYWENNYVGHIFPADQITKIYGE